MHSYEDLTPQHEAIKSEVNSNTNLKEKLGGEAGVRDWLRRLALSIPKGTRTPPKEQIVQVLFAALNRAESLELDYHKPAFDWDATPSDVIGKLDALIAAARKEQF